MYSLYVFLLNFYSLIFFIDFVTDRRNEMKTSFFPSESSLLLLWWSLAFSLQFSWCNEFLISLSSQLLLSVYPSFLLFFSRKEKEKICLPTKPIPCGREKRVGFQSELRRKTKCSQSFCTCSLISFLVIDVHVQFMYWCAWFCKNIRLYSDEVDSVQTILHLYSLQTFVYVYITFFIRLSFYRILVVALDWFLRITLRWRRESSLFE